ncbi:unnamed protein product [Vitrella brassicaformis CCMP3155]|uniref:D-lactate dehydrogenase (cytochrome) n=2 Tax=Vitrella brassicaformis TaxID=1169539 RepID=A0A0G4GF77_VITBC|nr:unnamed protein product [Vitrella brassicaformis CCMP3155]|mmetsp:Transcript_25626/g.63581  ORF Transcript_25626/g.63581 Transcript_25626/m.63581 type:complete len:595 (+) Transcript_25626:77-1861(+)|eukprot:CEM27799.1 unnamed protein product [Vitrella brassicaformis CCMP3155]
MRRTLQQAAKALPVFTRHQTAIQAAPASSARPPICVYPSAPHSNQHQPHGLAHLLVVAAGSLIAYELVSSRGRRRPGHAESVDEPAAAALKDSPAPRATDAPSLSLTTSVKEGESDSPLVEGGKYEVPRHVDDFPEAMQKLYSELRGVLGDRASVDMDEREPYRKDNWTYHKGEVPYIVVYPESTEEVSAILSRCNRLRIPVVAYGCGTSIEGHTVPVIPGVVINMMNMSEIVAVHEDDCDVVVQAGVQWMELNELLADTGLFFPIDPGPGASIGGMIGTRCSGTNAVRYGTMKDWVLQLTVVLADGRVVKTGTRARKDSAGYDLTRLFVGSEGTLGIVTEATLKLAARPADECVAVCGFPTVKDACKCVSSLIKAGIPVACVELLSADTAKLLNDDQDCGLEVKPTIFFKFTGTSNQVQECIETTQKMASRFGGSRLVFRMKENGESEKLWAARKGVYWSLGSQRPGKELWGTDVCVPLGRLPDVVEETQKDFAELGVEAPLIAHAGDGNFHLLIPLDFSDPEQMKRAQEANSRMIARAIAAGGTCTGEHGVGMGKKQYLLQHYPQETLEVMRSIKKTLDPNNILNPGKIFLD